MKQQALIIGNGPSRKLFDLAASASGFVSFGCNALYRDFCPDFLVAIDDKIIREIEQSDFPKHRFIVPPFEEQFEPAEYNPYQPRNNAGMLCMVEAIKRGFVTLNCIGLDFVVEDQNMNVGNVYDNTNGYDLSTRASYNDTINRCHFMNWFANRNQHVLFNFVYPDGDWQFRSDLLWSPNIVFRKS